MILSNQKLHGPNWSDSVNTSTKSLGNFGIYSIGGFLAVFVFWAVAVPISGATITSGKLVVEGKNKLIQHAEGGRIHKIFAREGDFLNYNDTIFTLESEVQASDVVIYFSRWVFKQAAALRLTALLNRRTRVDFESIYETSQMKGKFKNFIFEHKLEEEINLYFHQQGQYFRDARTRLEDEQEDLKRRTAEVKERILGAKTRLGIVSSELTIIQDQIKRIRPLVTKGYVARIRLDELESKSAELRGQMAATKSEIAGSGEQVKSFEAQVAQAESLARDAWGRELTATQSEISDSYQQLLSALDIFEKRIVRAPIAGTFVKVSFNTEGGVIRAGETVGEIVPSGTQMLAEVRINPEDISSVKLGQKVSIVISALDRHVSDPIDAFVTYVSSDTSVDEKTLIPFYVARLTLDKASTYKSVEASNAKLASGMQVQAYIRHPDRNFVSYLFKPVISSFRNAFKER